VHCTKISPDFECQGQRSRSPGQKNEKVRHFFWSRPLGCGPIVRRFLSGAVLGGAATPVGKSAHAV